MTRKIPLFLAALCANILSSFAQVASPSDSTTTNERKLKVEEVNFVSGYYQQDGNHSAVTGGIGTEHLTDFANTIDLKLSSYGKNGNKHLVSFEMGIDTYTSASSDSIDPRPRYSRDSLRIVSLSGPSSQDTRVYPSLSYSSENVTKGITLGAGISYSHEYDYISRGVNLSLVKSSKDKNRELNMKLLAYFDSWTVIYPYELRPPGYSSGSHEDERPIDILPRNSYQASFTLSQVINKRMQAALLFDPAYQKGQLTTLYQRVYFNDNSERVEKLPDNRFKIPIALRINYFLNDRVIIKAYYRYYHDDWGNTAHTVNLELPVKLSPFLSLSPFYRYSRQSGIDYFAPYKEHHVDENYYTSDYDLSPFSSQFIGMGFRIAPPKGVFGLQSWNSLEIRYGHYLQTTDLIGNILTLELKFK